MLTGLTYRIFPQDQILIYEATWDAAADPQVCSCCGTQPLHAACLARRLACPVHAPKSRHVQACCAHAPHARCQGLRVHFFVLQTNQPTSNTHWLLQRAAEVLYTWQEQYLNKDPLELSFYPHFYAERESGRQEVGSSWVGVLGSGAVCLVAVAGGWAD